MYKKEVQIRYFKEKSNKTVVLNLEKMANDINSLNTFETDSVKAILKDDDLSGLQIDVDSCTTFNDEYVDHDTYQIFISNHNRILEVI